MSVARTPEAQALIKAIAPSISADMAVDLLHAFYTAVRAEVERETRWQVAADFELLGKRRDTVGWGEAVMVAREGLCKCQGGSVPCPTSEAGAR